MDGSTYKKICLFSGIGRLINKTKDVDKYDILSVYFILAETIAISAKFYKIYNLFDIKDRRNQLIREKMKCFSNGNPLFQFTKNGLSLEIGGDMERNKSLFLMEMNSIMIDAVQGEDFAEIGPAARRYLANVAHEFFKLHLIGERKFTWDYIPVCAIAYYLHEQTLSYSIRLLKLIKMHSLDIEKDCYTFLSNNKWKGVESPLRGIKDCMKCNPTLRAQLRARWFRNTGMNLVDIIRIIQGAIKAFLSLHKSLTNY